MLLIWSIINILNVFMNKPYCHNIYLSHECVPERSVARNDRRTSNVASSNLTTITRPSISPLPQITPTVPAPARPLPTVTHPVTAVPPSPNKTITLPSPRSSPASPLSPNITPTSPPQHGHWPRWLTWSFDNNAPVAGRRWSDRQEFQVP